MNSTGNFTHTEIEGLIDEYEMLCEKPGEAPLDKDGDAVKDPTKDFGNYSKYSTSTVTKDPQTKEEMRNIIQEYNSFAKKMNSLDQVIPKNPAVVDAPTKVDDDWASAEEEYE